MTDTMILWSLGDDQRVVTITLPTTPATQLTLDAAALDELLAQLGQFRAHMLPPTGPRDWDLGFRRHHILVNGGDGFAGEGGAIALEGVAFDSLSLAPESGYLPSTAGRDSTSPAFEDWYDYGFTSHLLEPRPRVYAIRTADGRYAKLEIVSYYCPEAVSGCLTFRYAYQGSGARAF